MGKFENAEKIGYWQSTLKRHQEVTRRLSRKSQTGIICGIVLLKMSFELRMLILLRRQK